MEGSWGPCHLETLRASPSPSSPPCDCPPLLACLLSVVTSSRYFQAGGSPENVIQLLSENYTAVAQTVNLLAEWLIQTGATPTPNFNRPLRPCRSCCPGF